MIQISFQDVVKILPDGKHDQYAPYKKQLIEEYVRLSVRCQELGTMVDELLPFADAEKEKDIQLRIQWFDPLF